MQNWNVSITKWSGAYSVFLALLSRFGTFFAIVFESWGIPPPRATERTANRLTAVKGMGDFAGCEGEVEGDCLAVGGFLWPFIWLPYPTPFLSDLHCGARDPSRAKEAQHRPPGVQDGEAGGFAGAAGPRPSAPCLPVQGVIAPPFPQFMSNMCSCLL